MDIGIGYVACECEGRLQGSQQLPASMMNSKASNMTESRNGAPGVLVNQACILKALILLDQIHFTSIRHNHWLP